MSTSTLAACVVVLISVVIGIAVWRGKRGSKSTTVKQEAAPDEMPHLPGNFSILDQAGLVVFQGAEISTIPSGVQYLDLGNSMVQRTGRLVSEVFRGVVSLPNKSIELLFKPEIQSGLSEGTYTLMKTKAGETLADAIDASGKIVGKGRVIETGKLRQLAAGGYQLVSIIVAQSHLADIERSLAALQNAVSSVLDNLEATDRANITGSISYLMKLGQYIKQHQAPEDMPVQMKHVIEGLVLKSHIWRDKLHEDVAMLTKRIGEQSDIDSWGGTENTYKALGSHADAAIALLIRHELVMQLLAMINFIVTYVDPMGKQYSRPDGGGSVWAVRVESLSNTLNKKAEDFLSSAVFNSEEMLDHRKNDIARKAQSFRQRALEQQKNHDSSMGILTSKVNKYFSRSAEMRIALTFDANGEVQTAAMV
ncbi:hypothetical protein [Duganella vulcania]|uniref:Uncharacterized protein n=1 Tax=Duganella vulcania TaxID=2692166 RepID=A0A845GPM0_9BURK|nr:hypothetical protein [Duganella vulcania]MYM96493.1 hypothetical protein [Duganella vulcania]